MRTRRIQLVIGGAVLTAAALLGHARAQADVSTWEGALTVLDEATSDAADIDLTDGVAETCADVRSILSSFGSWGSSPIAIRIPGFDLGVGVESATVKADCGTTDNFLDVEGTVEVPRSGTTDLPVDVRLRLDWGSDTATVPEVIFELSVGGGPGGNIVALSDLIPIASALVPGSSVPEEGLPTDLRLQGFDLAFHWTDTGDPWLDVVASTQIRQAPDNVSDTVNVRVLLSMSSDPNGGAPTVLTGLHADPLLGDTFTLGMAFRGSIGDYLASIELPEMHMAQVHPSNRTVSLAQMPIDRSLPRQFFSDAGSTLPVEYEYDGEITLAAGVELDSLGDAVQRTFGYADGATATLLGKADISFGDLAGTDDHVAVRAASLDVTLPTLDGSQATALPDWLRVGATSFELHWDDEADAFVFGFSTSAEVDVPDRTQPGGEVTLSPTLAGEVQLLGEDSGDVLTIGMRGEIPGTAAAPAWPNPFGTSWLDLHSLGADVVVIAPLGDDPDMTLDIDAQVTGRFSLGDKEFSVGIGFDLRDGGTEFTINAKFLEAIGMVEVLDHFDVSLPDDFDVVIGTPEIDGVPVSITARLFLPPSGDPEGSIALNAPGTIAIGGGSFDVNFLVALETLPGGDYQIMAGARLASTTVTDLVSVVDTGLASTVASTPFGGVTLPDTALLFNLAEIDEPSHALSEEERAFFDPLHGCATDPCDYELRLDAGVHLLAAMTMPDDPEAPGKPVFDDVFRAFWLEGAPPVLLDLSVGLPAGDAISFEGISFDMRLPIRPGPDVRPDWFRSANLGIGLRVGTDGVTFEVSGDLGIRMRDESLTSESACGTAQKHWLPTGGAAPADACYDVLDFGVKAGVSLGPIPAFTLEGSIQSEGGWRSPFGLDFLEFGGVALQLRIEVPPSGNISVLIGFYVSGKLILDESGFEKDLAGSFVIGLRVLQSPPWVIPEFRGIRIASQAGIELADVVRLYDIARDQAQQIKTALPPDQVSPELAQLAALPALDLQDAGLPNISLRNLELMIGLGDFPAVCISTGVRLGAELYLGAEPVDGSDIDPETPGNCPDGPIADPVGCLEHADPCAAAVALDVGLQGIELAGSMGPFDLGPVQWDAALFDFALTPSSQRLRIRGGAAIEPLAAGTIDLTIAPEGFAFLGDVELFPGSSTPPDTPAFEARIEGEAGVDVAAFFAGGGQDAITFDIHAVLESDFDALMRELTEPLVVAFRDTVVAATALYDGLKETDGDVIQTLTDLPDDLRSMGATVPLWYDDPSSDLDALAALEKIDGLFRTAGLEPPTFGQVFSGVEFDDPFTLPGFWVLDACLAAPFVPGTVVDGECYSVHLVGIPGIGDLVPGAPGSFTEFLDGTVEPRLTTALHLLGLPEDVDFVDLTDTLVAQLRSITVPVALPCVDFRLTSTGVAPSLTLRMAAELFGLDLGLDVGWDFSKPAGSQALTLGTELLDQLFVSPATPECEPIGTTTIGGPLGEGDGQLVDTGFTPSITPDQVVEGSTVTLSGVYGPGLDDSTAAEIDWDDGTTEQTTVGALRTGVSHTYLDDDPTGTAADTISVAVTIEDRTETVLAAVLNAPPSELSLTFAVTDGVTTSPAPTRGGVPYVLEGETLVVTGEFRDPGHADTFDITIRWGDGTTETITDPQLVDEANDRWRFSTERSFPDDDPSGTPFDASSLAVVVRDDDRGRASAGSRYGVRNVAPSEVTVTPLVGGVDQPEQVDEGVPVTYRVEWDDPGELDSFAVLVDWGDGTVTPVLTDDQWVDVEHIYTDDDPTATAADAYSVRATIIDDDTSSGTGQQTVTVHNVDPAVTTDSNVLDEDDTISVQYSDPIGGEPTAGTLDSAVLTISAYDVTPDELTLTATFDDGALPSWLTMDFDETTDCAPVTDDDGHKICSWTVSQQPDPTSGIYTDIAPGTYDLELTVEDDDTGSWSDTITIEVLPEDARVWYVGPTFAATTSARTGTAKVELRSTIRDITSAVPDTDPDWDPWPGDIRRATMHFDDRNDQSEACAAAAIDEVFTPFDVFDPGASIGVGSCDWTADIGNSDAAEFPIGTVVGGYYERDESDAYTVVTIARPLTDFITGGGYLELTDSAGIFAGADGSKSNFGFHVKFNKKGTNLQGGVTLIVRAADGRVYRIKTNAMDSLGIDGSSAQFESKANIVDVSDQDAPVSVGGNFILQMLMTDGAEHDQIGFTLWDQRNVGGGRTTRELLLSSRWDGNQTLLQTLAGGELRVH